MIHPVLDSFDRLVALLDGAIPQGAPHGALVLEQGGPAVVVGRDPHDHLVVPYASVLLGGHTALAFYRALPGLLAAAEALRDSMAQVPGLAAVFANGGFVFDRPDRDSVANIALPYGANGPRTNLRMRLWCAGGRTGLAQMLAMDNAPDHTPNALRGALAQALESQMATSEHPVGCTLFHGDHLSPWIHATTFPPMLAAIASNTVPTTRTIIGTHQRRFLPKDVPHPHAPPEGWAVAHEVLDKVGAAYQAFHDAMLHTPPGIQHVRMAAHGKRACMFITEHGVHRHLYGKPTTRQAAGQARHDSGWFGQTARAWSDLLDAFPARSQWKAFALPRVVAYSFYAQNHGTAPTPIDVHPTPGGLYLSYESLPAWCTPARGPVRLVQTYDQGPVVQVRAAHDLGAIRLALRMCPVPKDKAMGFTLWDVWQPPKG